MLPAGTTALLLPITPAGHAPPARTQVTYTTLQAVCSILLLACLPGRRSVADYVLLTSAAAGACRALLPPLLTHIPRAAAARRAAAGEHRCAATAGSCTYLLQTHDGSTQAQGGQIARACGDPLLHYRCKDGTTGAHIH